MASVHEPRTAEDPGDPAEFAGMISAVVERLRETAARAFNADFAASRRQPPAHDPLRLAQNSG